MDPLKFRHLMIVMERNQESRHDTPCAACGEAPEQLRRSPIGVNLAEKLKEHGLDVTARWGPKEDAIGPGQAFPD